MLSDLRAAAQRSMSWLVQMVAWGRVNSSSPAESWHEDLGEFVAEIAHKIGDPCLSLQRTRGGSVMKPV